MAKKMYKKREKQTEAIVWDGENIEELIEFSGGTVRQIIITGDEGEDGTVDTVITVGGNEHKMTIGEYVVQMRSSTFYLYPAARFVEDFEEK